VRLEIFDVEHGQCALLTGTDGHILIDAGHNSTTGWRPSQMLARRGIRHLEGLVITNEDEDHASDLDNVLRVASVGTLYANPTISGDDIVNLKGQDRCGPGIFALADLLDEVGVPAVAGAHFDGVYVEAFWNDYPRHFENENNLSLVTFLHLPGLLVCFPGDMERAGWLRLLQENDFRAIMRGVHVFVASHHGRDNGRSGDLFAATGLAPQLIIISDAGIQHATQQTVQWYNARASGVMLHGQRRCVLTTRHDGMITFGRDNAGWLVNTWR
jgi:beta-lactamase superfamily II metal-dependent hydrolase